MITRARRTHKLKCWPEYFQMVISGDKQFELRKDDREYAVGDTLQLIEYDPNEDSYSGRDAFFRVSCVVRGMWLREGYVALGIKP